MSLRRKNWISLIALASLVACTTPPATQSKGTVTPTPAQQAAIDCGIDPFFLDENVKVSSFSRGPAKAGMCEELFKLTVGARIRNLTEEEGLALTKQIWDKERLRMEWAIGDSDAFWGTLMGKEKLEAALEKGISPIEVYGEMTARNWWAGVNRVNQIPIGKFKLNPEIVSDTNIEVVRGNNLLTRFELFDPMTAEEGKTRSKLFKFFNDKIKDLNRTYQIAGGRYRRRRLMHNYLAKAMSEEEFQVLKKDKDVHGIEFWEAPYSRPGKRFGLVRYPPVEVTNKKFEELMERTNQDIEEMRSGRSTKDPIAVAAEFQRAFVALHPMTNGNGRTSRILMNRILR
ncbi:MAG: Fic family protein, partial [Bdellovibrionaceae bacterium]|nr:Fic family protein [Pseudobdellovibrionaceae bacterium]